MLPNLPLNGQRSLRDRYVVRTLDNIHPGSCKAARSLRVGASVVLSRYKSSALKCDALAQISGHSRYKYAVKLFVYLLACRQPQD